MQRGERRPSSEQASSAAETRGERVVEAAGEFLGFQKVEVTKTDESKPWKPALEVKVTKADGTVVEDVDANVPFFTFKSGKVDAKDLTVSAAAAGHVDSLHIKGEEAGSRFDYPSLEALFKDVSAKIPDNVATEPGVSAFDVEMGKSMGKEGIASRDELLRDGVLRDSDIAASETVRSEVLELNKTGTPEQKQAFVEKFKQENPDCKIQFQLVRGTVLVPTVDTPKRDTTKLFLVFGPNQKGDKKTLYTAAPGRNMPRHPNPGQHTSKEGVLDEKTFKESAEAWFNTVMLTGK